MCSVGPPPRVSGAMTHLGLIPDAGLLKQDDDEIAPRLRRNLQQMERLSTADAPVDRVRDVSHGDAEASRNARGPDGGARRRPDGPLGDRRQLAAAPRTTAARSRRSSPRRPRRRSSMTSDPPTRRGSRRGRRPARTKTRQPRIKALIRCAPAARTIVGLDHLRLSVLHRPERSNELIDVGIQKTKKVATPARSNDFSWSPRLDVDDARAGALRRPGRGGRRGQFVRARPRATPSSSARSASRGRHRARRHGLRHGGVEARKAADRHPGAARSSTPTCGDGPKRTAARALHHSLRRGARLLSGSSSRGRCRGSRAGRSQSARSDELHDWRPTARPQSTRAHWRSARRGSSTRARRRCEPSRHISS